jgi:hypothetical protein
MVFPSLLIEMGDSYKIICAIIYIRILFLSTCQLGLHLFTFLQDMEAVELLVFYEQTLYKAVYEDEVY